MAGELGLGLKQGSMLGGMIGGSINTGLETRASKKQQEIMGGLRRSSLGLGGESLADQDLAAKQMYAIDPKATTEFMKGFDKLPDKEQDKIKQDNMLIAQAAVNVGQLPDEQLAQGLGQTAKGLMDQRKPELAEQALKLAQLAKTAPEAARQQLKIIEGQARTLEQSIASRENMQLEKIKQGSADLKDRLAKQKDQFGMVNEIRKDVNAISKDFTKVRDANNRVQAIFSTNEQAPQLAAEFVRNAKANMATAGKDIKMLDITNSTEAFGDMALVFSYMKINDPGSTVREGEYATVKNTGGADERVINMYNNALKGTILTPAQRQGIKNQADGLFKAAKDQNDKDIKRYKNQAKDLNLPMNQIFDDEQFTAMSDEEIDAAIAAGEAAQGGQQ